uniref:MYND-type domain-containing protein n=1 Tax=Panagrolaimus sp. PS1159 TaxID=55785 RepID=A0AC35GYP0_9BILA
MDSDYHDRMLNHLRICQLLARSAQKLVQIFLKRWYDYKRENWNGNQQSLAELIQLCEAASLQVKEALINRNMDLWDVTAACSAIQAISVKINKIGGSTNAKEDKAIFELRNARNDIYHGKSELSKEEFNKKWNNIANMLVKLGDNYADIKELKGNLMEIGKAKNEVMVSNTVAQQPNVSEDEKKATTEAEGKENALDKLASETSPIKAEDEKAKDIKAAVYSEAKIKYKSLKDEANKLFKAKEYKAAIDVYSKILQIPGLIPEDQAMIFSNLSATHLMFKDKDSLKIAELNAKWAIQVWPCWWRGYFRLARVQSENGEHRQAEESINKALALNPSSEEARNELSIVRGNISVSTIRVSKEEDSINELLIQKRYGIGKKQAKKIINKTAHAPGGEILLALKYFKEGNYSKAIQNFEIAANRGEPDALYYLGRIYHYGEGVNRDYKISMEYLMKAATTYRALPLNGGCISAAQYLIGRKYADGVGVEKDYRKAAEWYEKSCNNGYPDAASELGVMYSNGQGVTKSMEKAFNYFKHAAELGHPYGMYQLGVRYMNAEGTGSAEPTKEDLVLAKKWLKLAVKKGNTEALKELKDFEKYNNGNAGVMATAQKLVNELTPVPKNPMDKEQFGPYIKQAAKKGSVIAQRHSDIWKYLYLATEALSKNDSASVMVALANAIRLDHELAKVSEIFYPLIEDQMKTNSDNLETIICFINTRKKQSDGYEIEEKMEIKMKDALSLSFIMHSKRYTDNGQLIDKYLPKFPNDLYLLEQRVISHIGAEEFQKALTVVDNALALYPKSVQLLYWRAIVFCSQCNKSSEAIKALDNFLDIAPKGHNKIPECHYRKAKSYYSQSNNSKFIESYEDGLESEKKQLPCFLPNNFVYKPIFAKICDQLKSVKGNNKQSNISISTLNKIKLNVQRKFLISKCRAAFADAEEKATLSARPGSRIHLTNIVAKSQKTAKPPSLVSLKKITLREMDPTEDKIYNGFVFQATIIDWACEIGGISTVIEDENGNVQRLTVCNWPSKDTHFNEMIDAMKRFYPNSTVSIVNPYMRLAPDNLCFIRVENPAYILIDNTTAENRCHVCGVKAETMKCGRCLMSKYCSKECQIYDCKVLEHNIICKHLKKYCAYF